MLVLSFLFGFWLKISMDIFLITTALGAFFLTGCLRFYALKRSLVDIPNARSSHTVPTPRGGGIAIVLSFLAAVLFAAAKGLVGWSISWALVGGGAGIALLGFLDDHGHIAARWRLLGHFAGAAWVLLWLGGLPPFDVFGVTLQLGWWGHAFAAIYLVWVLNLYNFMDGIDGIASVEALCVCLSGALLYGLIERPDLVLLPVLLAAAVAGFLFWNFPPARIFMGDAGSGFLGLMLAALSLQAAWISPNLFWAWVILLGVFIVDATFTLVRRLLRGDKVYEAHRSHAYQYASRLVGRHLPVTLGVGLINVLWLLPVATLVIVGRIDGTMGVLVAYLPLLILAIKFRAGQLETSEI
jgi:Fuc2NAc and GlcNAc transferase